MSQQLNKTFQRESSTNGFVVWFLLSIAMVLTLFVGGITEGEEFTVERVVAGGLLAAAITVFFRFGGIRKIRFHDGRLYFHYLFRKKVFELEDLIVREKIYTSRSMVKHIFLDIESRATKKGCLLFHSDWIEYGSIKRTFIKVGVFVEEDR